MDVSLDKELQLRELFRARFSINEIVERTGLTVDAVVKVINAPRALKRSHETAASNN